MNDIAKWYANKAKEARELSEKLRAAKACGASRQVIQKLEDELELSRNVGD